MDPLFSSELQLKQSQKLLLTQAMKQSLHALALPQLELATWLREEIAQNPVLEESEREADDLPIPFDETQELNFEETGLEVLEALDESFVSFLCPDEGPQEDPISQIASPPSLFEHLMNQAKSIFSNKELIVAEAIIGALDRKGFFPSLLETVDHKEQERLLPTIQAFDTPGIAARNIRESLLIQLRQKGMLDTIAYTLLNEHYETLFERRFDLLSKKLSCSMSTLTRALGDISSLNFYPARDFLPHTTLHLSADLTLFSEGNSWQVRVHEEEIPAFRIAPLYLKELPSLEKEEQKYIRRYMAAGKWLLRSIQRRQQTLKRIGEFLVRHQAAYLTGASDAPAPLTLKEMASVPQLHPSTATRAIADKVLQCPRGLFPLKRCFTTSLKCRHSNEQAKQLIRELVAKENKRAPLSDQALVIRLRDCGIICARRTISKYRSLLGIGDAHSRKEYM